MEIQFTVIFYETRYGFTGVVAEVPGAIARGASLEEAEAKVAGAIQCMFAANRDLAEGVDSGDTVARKRFRAVLRPVVRAGAGSPQPS